MEIKRVRQEYNAEIQKLKTRITRLELERKGLASQVESKAAENRELLAICDNLEKLLNTKD